MTTPDLINDARSAARLLRADMIPNLNQEACRLDALADELERLRAQVAPSSAHHVAVSKAALQMVRNALRNDAEAGKTVRAEMLAELDKATFELTAAPAQQAEPQRYSPTGEGGMEVDSLGAWVKYRPGASDPAPSLTVGERERFEAWAVAQGLSVARVVEGGNYANSGTWMAWLAWQARAAITSAAQAEPVAVKFACWDADNGLETFDTQAEALEYATETLNHYRDDAKFDGEWPGDTDSMWVGAIHITHRPATTEPDEEGGVDYALKPVAAQPAAQAEPVAWLYLIGRIGGDRWAATTDKAAAMSAALDGVVHPLRIDVPSNPPAQGAGELPPLPEPDNSYVIDGPDKFNADQMRAYARAALAQQKEQQP